MSMAHPQGVAPHQDLLGERATADYTDAERKFAAEVKKGLDELLRGARTQLLVLRRYHGDSDRLAIMPIERSIDRAGLRLPVVEKILVSTLTFMRSASPGGPVIQVPGDEGLLETQQFSTRHPHIVIERRDLFPAHNGRTARHTEWVLRRIQNQRTETRRNRLLDAGSLALNLFDLVIRRF